jgi:hypothetical protein
MLRLKWAALDKILWPHLVHSPEKEAPAENWWKDKEFTNALLSSAKFYKYYANAWLLNPSLHKPVIDDPNLGITPLSLTFLTQPICLQNICRFWADSLHFTSRTLVQGTLTTFQQPPHTSPCLFFIYLFFCSTGVWTQGLHHEPLH